MSETTRAFDDGATTAEEQEREVLGWAQFGEAARDLAREVVRSGWMPDLVIAVARGGLVPAGAVAYALGTKAMGTLNVEFYTGVAETLPEPVVLPPLMDTSELPGKRVLVVDDVADSGRTLALVMDLIRTRGLPADVDGDGAVTTGETVAVDALGRRLRQAPLGHRAGLRLAPHRPVDHVPVVGAATGHGCGLTPSRSRTSASTPSAPRSTTSRVS